MKTKHKGISILIAMGASFLVLAIAFATMLSIQKMMEQTDGLERSTKLFFAAESGIEAAFYHHNARGQGVNFSGTPDSQKVDINTNIGVEWKIEGQSNPIIGLLKEEQSIQIPLYWDSNSDPINTPNESGKANNIIVEFYHDSDAMGGYKDKFEDLFGGPVVIDSGFDFGDSDNKVLIDWSVARTNSVKGIQTFSPKNNDCTTPSSDFICKNDLLSVTSVKIDSTAITGGKNGRVLPGYIHSTVTLNEFMSCSGLGVDGSDSCKKYVLTFRPLLKFKDSNTGKKIPGIPYIIKGKNGGSPVALPRQSYTVTANVSLGDYSQKVSIKVPEKTSIGAFDYVVFD